jgi:hypothetical protein
MMEEDSLETFVDDKGFAFNLVGGKCHAPHVQFTTWKRLHAILGLA